MASQREIFERMLIPALEAGLAPLDALAVAISPHLIVASPFAFGAAMVAEKRALLLVQVIVQSMAQLFAFEAADAIIAASGRWG